MDPLVRKAIVLMAIMFLAIAGLGIALKAMSANMIETTQDEPNYRMGEITISYWPQGEAEGEPIVATIPCDNSYDLCERITNEPAFKPSSPDVACTEIYGGPEFASLEYEAEADRADVASMTFSRINGCEIARWDRLVEILGDSGYIALTPPVMPPN